MRVPDADQGVRAAGGEVSPAPAELDADAVAGVGLEHMLGLQLGPRQDLDTALSIGQEEQVGVLVPTGGQPIYIVVTKLNYFVPTNDRLMTTMLATPPNLVDLELELLVCLHLVGLGVYEGYEVLLVPHGNGLSVRSPSDVYVLALRIT